MGYDVAKHHQRTHTHTFSLSFTLSPSSLSYDNKAKPKKTHLSALVLMRMMMIQTNITAGWVQCLKLKLNTKQKLNYRHCYNGNDNKLAKI